jgi:hypothetical protein
MSAAASLAFTAHNVAGAGAAGQSPRRTWRRDTDGDSAG